MVWSSHTLGILHDRGRRLNENQMALMAKARGRPFPPGNTASSGRPPGSRNQATQAAQGLFSENSEAVSKKCLVLAMQGNSTALRLCMERVLPACKSMPSQFKLPKVRGLADLPKAAEAILQAVANGELTPDQGERMMALLERYRAIRETAELVPRVETLERQNKIRKPGSE
jgi:hypothetical protein